MPPRETLHEESAPSVAGPSSWAEYRLLVLAEIERLGRQVVALDVKQDASTEELRTALNALQHSLVTGLYSLRTDVAKESGEGLAQVHADVLAVQNDLREIRIKAAAYGTVAGTLIAVVAAVVRSLIEYFK